MRGDPSNGERHRRAVRNQSRFRERNERIEALRSPATYIGFACECADERCGAEVPMTVEEYESVRRVPTRFLVAPEHDVPELERVVEAGTRYSIVEKSGEDATAAITRDPRAPAAAHARERAPEVEPRGRGANGPAQP